MPSNIMPKRALDRLTDFLHRLFGEERRAQIQEVLNESIKWKPASSSRRISYAQEMQDRIDYFDLSMQGDMLKEFLRQRPQSHEDVDEDQLNLGIVRKKITDKARVFGQSGDLYLVDASGERVVGDDANIFDAVIKESMAWSSLKKMDQYTQLCERAMWQPWADVKKQKMMINVWAPHLVHIWPDPDRWWDPDQAYAVLFEMPGSDGLASTNRRYLVWGRRESMAAKSTGQETIHYVTDGERDQQVNEDDRNPFVDPRTDRAVYPFVWWRNDAGLDLYSFANEDMLTVNRRVNGMLTDLIHGIKFLCYGAWIHTMPEGSDKGLGVKRFSPGDITDLQYGARLENIAGNVPITELWELSLNLIDMDAALEGLGAGALRKQGTPESGIAYRLKQKSLIEHRNNMVEIYPVAESIYRLCIVYNTFAPSWGRPPIKGLAEYRVHWVPGDMDIPMNEDEIAAKEAALKEMNVITPIDIRMREYEENRDVAEAAVRANAEINAELSRSGQTFNSFGMETPQTEQSLEQIEEEENEGEGEE